MTIFIILSIFFFLLILFFLIIKGKNKFGLGNLNQLTTTKGYIKKFLWVNFSFSGRINRFDYWIYGHVMWWLVILILFVLASMSEDFLYYSQQIPTSINTINIFSIFASTLATPFASMGVLFLISIFALEAKRLHDHNRSGWWVVLILIPFINILFFIYIIIVNWFLRGTKGDNDYGSDSVFLQLSIDNYKDSIQFNKIFNTSLYVLLVAFICEIIADFYYISIGIEYSDTDGAGPFLYLYDIKSAIQIVVFCMGAIWIYRSNYIVRYLGAKEMKFTQGWSIGWYFIPIVCFWKPYQALKEIYLKTYNLNSKTQTNDNIQISFQLWWFFWLSVIISLLVYLIGMDSYSSHTTFDDLYDIVLYITRHNFIYLIFFYKIVQSINLMQKQIYDQLGRSEKL